MTDLPTDGRALFSTVRDDGTLALSIEPIKLAPLGPDEVLIRVEATPVNPSDMGMLFGPADVSTARTDANATHPTLLIDIPEALRRAVAARQGQPMPVGNEGAGTVIAAGENPDAQALIGKVVATWGGGLYRSYRIAKTRDCLILPDGATPQEAASLTVNPMTASAFIGVLKREGHKALVHTAAASNLGQMLVRLCRVEGIPLVNIVRSTAQEDLLRGLGAEFVLNSTDDDFMEKLVDALVVTDATLGFDAIGGGKLAGQILGAMEQAQSRKAGGFSVYGTNVNKQVYIYGALDTGPTILTRSFGLTWGVSGFLLTPYLMQAGAEETARMRQYCIDHRNDIFASRYTADITLDDFVKPEMVQAMQAKATGQKYLVTSLA
jgi:NADPH:quinone reductase-like Zn-dependent oxidoreductase